MMRIVLPLAAGLLLAGCTHAPAVTHEHISEPDSNTLILTSDEIRTITSINLEQRSDQDHHEPAGGSLYDDMPVSCRNVYQQDREFGADWSNFRATYHSGPSNIAIGQAIAVYPDRDAASRVYDQIKGNLAKCVDEFPTPRYGDTYKLGLLNGDTNTQMLQYPDTTNGPGTVRLIHLQSGVLIDVSAVHFGADPRTAAEVLQRIEDKLEPR